MKNNKNSAKNKKKAIAAKRFFTRKRLLVGGLALLLIVGVAAQLCFDLYVYNRVQSGGDTVTITQLTTDAVNNLHKPAVMDPQGKQYMPEARLVLPASEAPYNQLRYSYAADTDNNKSWMNITTQEALGTATAMLWAARSVPYGQDSITSVFESLPALQACSRGVTATFDADSAAAYPSDGLTTVRLADGRTLYMSLFDSKKCTTDLSGLIDFLKQAESY